MSSQKQWKKNHVGCNELKMIKRVKGNAGRMLSTLKKMIKSMVSSGETKNKEIIQDEPIFLDNEKVKRLVELAKEQSVRMPSNLTRKERHEWAKKMVEREFGKDG